MVQMIQNGLKLYQMAQNDTKRLTIMEMARPKCKKEHKSVRNTLTKHKRYKVIWHKVSKKDLSFFSSNKLKQSLSVTDGRYYQFPFKPPTSGCVVEANGKDDQNRRCFN